VLAETIPGKTNTMPLSIYTNSSSGDWSTANLWVVSLTLLSGVALYLANKYSRGI
jgi:molybdate transport system permease protein